MSFLIICNFKWSCFTNTLLSTPYMFFNLLNLCFYEFGVIFEFLNFFQISCCLSPLYWVLISCFHLGSSYIIVVYCTYTHNCLVQWMITFPCLSNCLTVLFVPWLHLASGILIPQALSWHSVSPNMWGDQILSLAHLWWPS